MQISDLLTKRRQSIDSLKKLRQSGGGEGIRECPGCRKNQVIREIRENLLICPSCDYYFPMRPKDWIRLLADEKSFREMDRDLVTRDPLHFPGYEEKLLENQKKSGNKDAAVIGTIRIRGILTAVGILDGSFLMGSMGTVVGEKIARIAEYAKAHGLPLILISASGGARMQEGLFSLMQMAKTSAAVERFKQSGGLFVSILTNPTTGGVSASFAMLGDIILAEPEALICFAGPRVIQQTIGEKLPEGFQRSEFLLEHGMLDAIVKRQEMKAVLAQILRLHGYEPQ